MKYRFKQLEYGTDIKDYGTDIAELIYDTDLYIYPAWFETKENAKRIISELLKCDDEMFSCSNLFVALVEEKVIAIILWHKGSLLWNDLGFKEVVSKLKIPISKRFEEVKERYISTYSNVDQDIVSIINFCVKKEYRNQGVGQKILEEFLKVHGNEKVELCVLEENEAAVKLYEKNGFRCVEKYNGFSVDNINLPCLLMCRKSDGA